MHCLLCALSINGVLTVCKHQAFSFPVADEPEYLLVVIGFCSIAG